MEEAGFRPGERVIEIGAGAGAITLALAGASVNVLAVERDPIWAARVRRDVRSHDRVRVIETDFLSMPLPSDPFRVIGSLPFGRTTDILRRLLDDPSVPMVRADLVVQWNVARKRATVPPSTLRSTVWAPWWQFSLGRRIPAREFRPRPRVDAGVLVVTRRDPPLLPPAIARPYERFVRGQWPMGQ